MAFGRGQALPLNPVCRTEAVSIIVDVLCRSILFAIMVVFEFKNK